MGCVSSLVLGCSFDIATVKAGLATKGLAACAVAARSTGRTRLVARSGLTRFGTGLGKRLAKGFAGWPVLALAEGLAISSRCAGGARVSRFGKGLGAWLCEGFCKRLDLCRSLTSSSSGLKAALRAWTGWSIAKGFGTERLAAGSGFALVATLWLATRTTGRSGTGFASPATLLVAQLIGDQLAAGEALDLNGQANLGAVTQ